MIQGQDAERRAAIQGACALAAAGRTAPKTRGIDNILSLVIDEPAEIAQLARTMRDLGKKNARPSFERDGGNIEQAGALVVFGVRNNPAGLNCGYCGSPTCDSLIEKRGICAFNSIDLGITIGSAVACAADLRLDNRVMYSIGRAAMELDLFGEKVAGALGIPISVTGKNPYFDRK